MVQQSPGDLIDMLYVPLGLGLVLCAFAVHRYYDILAG
jgi:hypothetical protein